LKSPRLRWVRPEFRSAGSPVLLSYEDLDLPGLLNGMLVFRRPGDLSDHRGFVARAREEVSRMAGERAPLIVLRQVHGSSVTAVEPQSEFLPPGDGLVTDRKGLAIGVTVADCLPLFAADTRRGVIGVAHCGWRGVSRGIVEELVTTLESRGAEVDSTVFLAGASIGPCCYEVGEDLLARFGPADLRRGLVERKGEGLYFDLRSVVAGRLLDRAPRARISIDITCTSCEKYILSSYRAGGRECGRMLAFIMLTE
jgi:hypothetical protein